MTSFIAKRPRGRLPTGERHRIIAALRAHEAELRARGVTSLALFSSIARGDGGARSDVDLLVQIDPAQAFSLVDLAGLKRYLRDLVGRSAHVTIKDNLRPFLRDAILADCVPVF
ncbi:MAG TPA: nucleotidyltransferase domain-containing protein [Alphaproteobacteria bacterium]|nr:nucleotidyltransferase domain-containing protein [Alphaproteobacteria bacterium]